MDILRFKSIIKIKDKDNLGLPFVLRKSMEQLDGKPFLAGKLKDNKSARFVGDCYLEFDSLTQNYSYFARKVLNNSTTQQHKTQHKNTTTQQYIITHHIGHQIVAYQRIRDSLFHLFGSGHFQL